MWELIWNTLEYWSTIDDVEYQYALDIISDMTMSEAIIYLSDASPKRSESYSEICLEVLRDIEDLVWEIEHADDEEEDPYLNY